MRCETHSIRGFVRDRSFLSTGGVSVTSARTRRRGDEARIGVPTHRADPTERPRAPLNDLMSAAAKLTYDRRLDP